MPRCKMVLLTRDGSIHRCIYECENGKAHCYAHDKYVTPNPTTGLPLMTPPKTTLAFRSGGTGVTWTKDKGFTHDKPE